ncbi:uncharacterized protein LOC119388778 [Rhipicephalus sanguineus]|uniref:uncharacterized protein LOC119388778 n=1 Tax=Rhipicephalus sanguineus TaxID=34632 RepID=UPI0018932888|nr:uncharacterized protein LOC119388778 [Rhipicephalus sanguineus]
MGGLFSAPSAQRCPMSTDSDRSGSPAPPVTVSTTVRVTRGTSGNRKRTTVRVVKVRASRSASSVDAATSSESSDWSEYGMWDNASESAGSHASDATRASSSAVASFSGTSLVSSASSNSSSSNLSSSSSSSLSSDEWAARSPPHKLQRCRWPFTTRRRRSSRRVSTNDHAEADEASENGNREIPGTSGDLIRKLRELEDALTCAICMERRRKVVFMCGHTACSSCATRIDVCHICRRPIERMIRLH